MLKKTVLCADERGACKLVEVPFSWQHGDALPQGAIEYWFPTATAALSEMANRGRGVNRFDVRKPRKQRAAIPPEAPRPDRQPRP